MTQQNKKKIKGVDKSGVRVLKSGLIKREHSNVCIFCGGNMGSDTKIKTEAEKFAQTIASRGFGMVYGGASVGVMGFLADTVLDGGGKVHGVIPQSLVDKEVAHNGLTELRIVSTMHERKKIMFDLSDAFVTFPGGFGTLDETFEIITWKQIGLHQKPLILMNINGFFDTLISFIDKATEAGFIKKEHRGLFQVATTTEEAFALIDKHLGN